MLNFVWMKPVYVMRPVIWEGCVWKAVFSSAVLPCVETVQNSVTACEQTASWTELLVQSSLNEIHPNLCLTSTAVSNSKVVFIHTYQFLSLPANLYFPLRQIDDTFLCILLYYCIWKREISRIGPVRLNLNKKGTTTVYKCMAKCLQIYINRKFTP